MHNVALPHEALQVRRHGHHVDHVQRLGAVGGVPPMHHLRQFLVVVVAEGNLLLRVRRQAREGRGEVNEADAVARGGRFPILQQGIEEGTIDLRPQRCGIQGLDVERRVRWPEEQHPVLSREDFVWERQTGQGAGVVDVLERHVEQRGAIKGAFEPLRNDQAVVGERNDIAGRGQGVAVRSVRAELDVERLPADRGDERHDQPAEDGIADERNHRNVLDRLVASAGPWRPLVVRRQDCADRVWRIQLHNVAIDGAALKSKHLHRHAFDGLREGGGALGGPTRFVLGAHALHDLLQRAVAAAQLPFIVVLAVPRDNLPHEFLPLRLLPRREQPALEVRAGAGAHRVKKTILSLNSCRKHVWHRCQPDSIFG